MARLRGTNDFDHEEIPATGILLTNLGSPDAPTVLSVRRYLRQFLSDPRVIEKQGPIWRLVLEGIVLRKRPARVAPLYASIWGENAEAPLVVATRSQATAIERELATRIGSPLRIEVGMRYGQPSIGSALRRLADRACRRILVLPLYPQYASASTGSAFDAVSDEVRTWRWVPDLRMITCYHDDPGYVAALAGSVRELWQEDGEPDRLVFSFHGIPLSTFLAGDPYHCQCQKTARLVAEELELPAERWMVCFQSRFGREEWMRPYTDITMGALPGKGVRSVDVICPGFSADCLETTEEVAIQNREIFEKAGGEKFRYIPALNDRAEHVAALGDLVVRNLSGWVVGKEDWDEDEAKQTAARSAERARRCRAETPNAPS
jgi:ferrochelatase